MRKKYFTQSAKNTKNTRKDEANLWVTDANKEWDKVIEEIKGTLLFTD
ncbi:MAG: hypothetical protein Q6360_02750 [Candidatus Brocadiales bacterium]|nr:hypothetical protein [Candidatus Brocadiales bacterium]